MRVIGVKALCSLTRSVTSAALKQGRPDVIEKYTRNKVMLIFHREVFVFSFDNCFIKKS
jgi:hypothetical protein